MAHVSLCMGHGNYRNSIMYDVISLKTASVVYWSEFLATQRRCIVFLVRYELNLYMLCRRK
jgi:hypothetical protein